MIHATAIVRTTDIGQSARILEYAVVREGAVIGNDVVIHPFVVVEPGVVLGDGVEVFPGAYIGKEPKGAGALARLPVFERRAVIGANTSIGPHALIYYDVEIGENTLIGDGASIREQCRIGAMVIVGRHVTINYNVKVGSGTKIMDHSWLAGNMVVEDEVFISGGVLTANDNDLGRLEYKAERVQGPTIRKRAAIGVGASLLPAAVIGEGAVVGAGALVTRDVAPYTLVMGVPAKHVRDLEKTK